MYAVPIRRCTYIKHLNKVDVFVVSNSKAVTAVNYQNRNKSDKSGSCCKEIVQTEGKRLEPWPKADVAPQPWRAECPQDPQPPNYDPYRIKVPNVVVPPLPPTNVKSAIDCTKKKGPCSVLPPPLDPPCPPPPRRPFPWIYVWPWALLLTTMGIFYKLYLLKELWDKMNDNKPIWRPRPKVKRPNDAADLPACVQYLIIGTGAAGWSAYQTIMKNDKTAKVFFITKEDISPYIRPPLSKHMWWNQDPPDVKTLSYIQDNKRHTMYLAKCENFMDPVKFYRKPVGPAVALASGWCVLRIDPDEHAAWVQTLCGEQPIYYERCLLAPGSKAKNLSIFKTAPKSVRDKVCTLRTIRDLEIAFRSVRAAKHVTIIGGGALGCELAWHLGRMNKMIERPEDTPPLEITQVFKDKGILAGIVPEYLGEWAVERIKCEHVKTIPKTQVYDAFETPDGRLELTLSNGTSLITDYVFVAVGSTPREEIAKPSFLELDKINGGFEVNTELEARKHLYVAGDAASFYSQWKDTRLRCEHYDNAEQQGVIAGENMTGYWTPCNMEPHYWIRLDKELEVEIVGEVGACMPTVGLFKQCTVDELAGTTTSQDKGDPPCYKSEEYLNRYKRGMLFYLRNETVVGVVMWNIPPVDDRRDVVTEVSDYYILF